MVDVANQLLSTLPTVQTQPPCAGCEQEKILPTIDPRYYRSTLSAALPRFEVLEPYTPQKPSIDTPEDRSPPTALWSMLQVHLKQEALQQENLKVFGEEVDTDLQKIEKLEKKHAELIKEAIKQQKVTSNWNILSDIASYLSSSASLFMGVATIASGGSFYIAGALIASAGLGLANRIVQDTVGWNTIAKYFSSVKETQEKLEQNIQLGFTATSIVLGIGGGVAQMGQMANLINEQGSRILQTGLQLFTGTSQLGKSINETRLTSMQAKQLKQRQLLQRSRIACISRRP